jgi:hypothetical protein
MHLIDALRQFGTPCGWIAFVDGSAGRYVSQGTLAGSDARAGTANETAATKIATAKAPLPMRG